MWSGIVITVDIYMSTIDQETRETKISYNILWECKTLLLKGRREKDKRDYNVK